VFATWKLRTIDHRLWINPSIRNASGHAPVLQKIFASSVRKKGVVTGLNRPGNPRGCLIGCIDVERTAAEIIMMDAHRSK
jgi:hypothetical protein